MKAHDAFIFITGGVVSSQKRPCICSIRRTAAARGFGPIAYRSLSECNPGTMSPYQHGEVFVTDDGAETDLDLATMNAYGRCSTSK